MRSFRGNSLPPVSSDDSDGGDFHEMSGLRRTLCPIRIAGIAVGSQGSLDSCGEETKFWGSSLRRKKQRNYRLQHLKTGHHQEEHTPFGSTATPMTRYRCRSDGRSGLEGRRVSSVSSIATFFEGGCGSSSDASEYCSSSSELNNVNFKTTNSFEECSFLGARESEVTALKSESAFSTSIQVLTQDHKQSSSATRDKSTVNNLELSGQKESISSTAEQLIQEEKDNVFTSCNENSTHCIADGTSSRGNKLTGNASTLTADCELLRSITPGDIIEIEPNVVRYHDGAAPTTLRQPQKQDGRHSRTEAEKDPQNDTEARVCSEGEALVFEDLFERLTMETEVSIAEKEESVRREPFPRPPAAKEESLESKSYEHKVGQLLFDSVADDPSTAGTVEKEECEEYGDGSRESPGEESVKEALDDNRITKASSKRRRNLTIDYHDLSPTVWSWNGQVAKYVQKTYLPNDDLASTHNSNVESTTNNVETAEEEQGVLGHGLGIILDKLRNIETKLDEIKSMEEQHLWRPSEMTTTPYVDKGEKLEKPEDVKEDEPAHPVKDEDTEDEDGDVTLLVENPDEDDEHQSDSTDAGVVEIIEVSSADDGGDEDDKDEEQSLLTASQANRIEELAKQMLQSKHLTLGDGLDTLSERSETDEADEYEDRSLHRRSCSSKRRTRSTSRDRCLAKIKYCWRCHHTGHESFDCTEEVRPANWCPRCLESSHWEDDCWVNDKQVRTSTTLIK